MSFFHEIESCAAPDTYEPDPVEVEKHLHSKVLHTIDDSEQICEKCGSALVKAGGEFVRTEVPFIPAKLKVIDHYRETYECRSCRKKGSLNIRKHF